jgi:hypothetical protein
MTMGWAGTSDIGPTLVVVVGRDLVDHVHALGDSAEHRVAEGGRRLALVIEEVIGGEIDEELRGGAVGLGAARHGQRATLVLETVGGFVLDRAVRLLLFEGGCEAAALDHEIGDHAVEHRAVVEAGFHVVEKIGHRDRRFLGCQLDGNAAFRGFQHHARIGAFVGGMHRAADEGGHQHDQSNEHRLSPGKSE